MCLHYLDALVIFIPLLRIFNVVEHRVKVYTAPSITTMITVRQDYFMLQSINELQKCKIHGKLVGDFRYLPWIFTDATLPCIGYLPWKFTENKQSIIVYQWVGLKHDGTAETWQDSRRWAPKSPLTPMTYGKTANLPLPPWLWNKWHSTTCGTFVHFNLSIDD